MKYIDDLKPDPASLIESMRDIGYSMATAVADLIDNSITAKAVNIHIRFSWNDGEPWLAILDDGHGMDENEITAAMRLGSKNPNEERSKDDLGRYGLGLKTASFSQCKKLTVLSKVKETIEGREWDLDLISKSEDGLWTLSVLEDSEIKETRLSYHIHEHGTLVMWQKLDRLDNFDKANVRERKLLNLIDSTRKHLELTFHRFLSPQRGQRKVNMFLNGDALEAFNPFNPSNPATRELPEQRIHLENEIIPVQAYILPHYNKVSRTEYEKYAGESGYLQNQGFYVYRNRRLIIKSNWFRLNPREELTKLLRVQVDIPNTLDHRWKIDIKKANASPPEAIRSQLKQIIYGIQDSGKQVYKQKGTRLRSNVTTPAWEKKVASGNITYVINKGHPMITKLEEQLQPDQQHILADILVMLEGSFPRELFYSDIAKNPETVERPAFDEEQFSSMLDRFIAPMIASNVPRNEIAQRLLSIDPFAAYAEDVKALLQNKGYCHE